MQECGKRKCSFKSLVYASVSYHCLRYYYHSLYKYIVSLTVSGSQMATPCLYNFSLRCDEISARNKFLSVDLTGKDDTSASHCWHLIPEHCLMGASVCSTSLSQSHHVCGANNKNPERDTGVYAEDQKSKSSQPLESSFLQQQHLCPSNA